MDLTPEAIGAALVREIVKRFNQPPESPTQTLLEWMRWRLEAEAVQDLQIWKTLEEDEDGGWVPTIATVYRWPRAVEYIANTVRIV